MRTRRTWLLVCLLWPMLLAAQAPPLPSDAGARIEPVAPDVYAIVHDDASDEWPHGNTGVVIGAEGVLVIDATYLPSRARADIALIGKLTRAPVRYLLYTHWHMDHNNGASAYRDAFPNVVIVSERESAGWTALNQAWWAKMSTAPDSTRRAALATLREQLQHNVDAAGAPLGAAARSALERSIAQRAGELEELASLRVIPPDLTFEGRLVLPFERESIELVDQGRGNSPHDVTIWLPRQRVLFAGDLLVQSPLPYTGASWPLPWRDVLTRIEAIPAAAIVPGHGPILRDHGYTRAVARLLDATIERVRAQLALGRTLEQAQEAIDLSDVRAATPAWRDPALDSDFRTVTRVLIERAWRGVRGQG